MRILSWTEQQRTINLKQVDDAAIKKASSAIIRASKMVWRWIEENDSKKRPAPPSMASIAPIVKLFGFDPFIGELYRGIRTDKTFKRGDKVKITSPFDTLSWTIQPKIAEKFASSDYSGIGGRELKSIKPNGYVLRLNSSGMQTWSMQWFLAVLERVAPVLKSGDVTNLLKYLRGQIRHEEEVLVMFKGPMTVTVIKEVKW